MLGFKHFTEQAIKEPKITLYRGSGSGPETGSFWTKNLDLAKAHASQRDGVVHKITIPHKDVPTYFSRQQRGAGEVHVLKRGMEGWANKTKVIHEDYISEMPILGTGLKAGSDIHDTEEQEFHRNEHEDSIKNGQSIKIGNVGGLHLYKESIKPKKQKIKGSLYQKETPQTSIYRLVHPKTGNVHMSLDGEEENGSLNIYKVGKHISEETPKAEDFYLGLAKHDKGLKDINSDTILTSGGLGIWKKLVEKGKRLGHNFYHKGKEIGKEDITPDGEFTSFNMKIKR